jgi:hypothetical protein
MNNALARRKTYMFKKIASMMLVTLLILLVAAPLMSDEKGAARFNVVEPLFAAGTEIKTGQYDIKWETVATETTVEFVQIGKPSGVKVKGKIEQVNNKYDYNSIATGKDSAGRLAVKQLQFRGKNIRIVFE